MRLCQELFSLVVYYESSVVSQQTAVAGSRDVAVQADGTSRSLCEAFELVAEHIGDCVPESPGLADGLVALEVQACAVPAVLNDDAPGDPARSLPAEMCPNVACEFAGVATGAAPADSPVLSHGSVDCVASPDPPSGGGEWVPQDELISELRGSDPVRALRDGDYIAKALWDGATYVVPASPGAAVVSPPPLDLAGRRSNHWVRYSVPCTVAPDLEEPSWDEYVDVPSGYGFTRCYGRRIVDGVVRRRSDAEVVDIPAEYACFDVSAPPDGRPYFKMGHGYCFRY